MVNFKTCVAAALCLTALSSHAGVIYEWHPITNESPKDFALTLEFDEETVRTGSIDLSISRSGVGGGYIFPDSGLISLRYPRGMFEFSPRVPSSSNLGESVGMHLNFEPGGLLSGYVRGSNYQEQFYIASIGTLFTVLDANSDSPMLNCPMPRAYQCAGATGEMRQVPEPMPLALLAVGAAAAVGVRRRKK